MMQQFRAQAERFGTRFVTDDATRVELSDGGIQRVCVGDEEHLAKTVILAMGAEPKRLGIPGEHGARRPRRLHLRRLRRRLLQGRGRRRHRRRRLGDGGLDLHLEVRLRADDRPPPRRVPRLEDHARARQASATTSTSRPRSSRRSSSPATTARSPASGCATPRPARRRASRSAAPSSRSATRRAPSWSRAWSTPTRTATSKTQDGLHADQPRRRLRGRRPRRPHLPPGGHRRRHRAAWARSTPSGTCATRRPRPRRTGSAAASRWRSHRPSRPAPSRAAWPRPPCPLVHLRSNQ